MVELKCIEKLRDKHGKIYKYKLIDSLGQSLDITADELKKAIKNEQLRVTNLALTKDNRLVDKKLRQSKEEKEGTSSYHTKSYIITSKIVEHISDNCGYNLEEISPLGTVARLVRNDKISTYIRIITTDDNIDITLRIKNTNIKTYIYKRIEYKRLNLIGLINRINKINTIINKPDTSDKVLKLYTQMSLTPNFGELQYKDIIDIAKLCDIPEETIYNHIQSKITKINNNTPYIEQLRDKIVKASSDKGKYIAKLDPTVDKKEIDNLLKASICTLAITSNTYKDSIEKYAGFLIVLARDIWERFEYTI